MAAGSSQTWSAKKRDSVAGTRPAPPHQKVSRPVVDPPDQLPEVRLGHDVVDRVPRVIGRRHVVEEQEYAREKLQRYREEHRATQGVEPGPPLGDRLEEEVLGYRDYPGPVLHPVDDELAGFCRLGS